MRKTMLDDCKGERLEEILALLSNTVLKKVLLERGSDQHQAIVRQLAYENFSYTGERTVLSALILAHKGSLGKHLRAKEEAKAKYQDFSNLLDLNDRRIIRRHEQLKERISERSSQEKRSSEEIRVLQDQVQRNWSGSDEWLESILYGESRLSQDGLLATPFERVWKHVECNSIGDVEGKQGVGLLEQLEARVRDQENRLAGWQDFGRTLSKSSPGSPKKENPLAKATTIDLGFNHHQELQIGRTNPKAGGNIASAFLDEYTRLVENMKAELIDVKERDVRTTRSPRQILRPEKVLATLSTTPAPETKSPSGNNEEWSSVSDTDEPSPGFNATKSTAQTPPSELLSREQETKEEGPETPLRSRISAQVPKASTRLPQAESKTSQSEAIQKERSLSPNSIFRTPPPVEVRKANDSESELVDHILKSMSDASPSPKKQRHKLSLAERTRLSMARTSHSQYSEMHDDCDNLTDLPRLSIRPKPTSRASLSASSADGKYADLIERTRKSMAGFEAAQKKAQLERRRSVKDQKKKQRESSYFPRLEEEEIAVMPDIDKQELMEGDPDYEDVFKSRPKIKTSPAVSPTRS